jgi:hypothetical protein
MSDDEAVKAITAVFNRIQSIQLLMSKLQYSSARWYEVEALAVEWGFRECYVGESCEMYVGLARMRIAALQRNDCSAEARVIAMTDCRIGLPPKYLDDDPMGDLIALQEWCVSSKRTIQAAVRQAPTPYPPGDPLDDYKPSEWFEKNTSISGESLRKAVSEGKILRSYGPKSQKRYSLSDAKKLWPAEFPDRQA